MLEEKEIALEEMDGSMLQGSRGVRGDIQEVSAVQYSLVLCLSFTIFDSDEMIITRFIQGRQKKSELI